MGRFIFRKMLKNKFLILFLMLSALLTVTMVASIPIYSNGVIQRVLISEMDAYQNLPEGEDFIPSDKSSADEYQNPFNQVNREVSKYAGNYIIDADLKNINQKDRQSAYEVFSQVILDGHISEIELPIICQTVKMVAPDFTLVNEKQNARKYVHFRSYSGMEEHIDLLDGRLPQATTDGTVEAVISQSSLKKNQLLCGDTYELTGKDKENPLKVKVVGVFVPKAETATIFTEKESEYASSLFINQDEMLNRFLNNLPDSSDKKVNGVNKVQWYYVLDYNELTVDKLQSVERITSSLEGYFSNYSYVKFNIPMLMVLEGFYDKQVSISKTLMAIELPILALLVLLTYMLSSMLVEFDKNEISVLRSRGAGRLRITGIYAIEGVIIALTAFIVGPFLSQLVCKMLGTPNGYLNMGERYAIDTPLNWEVFVYSAVVAVLLVVAIALPAFIASSIDIVQLKRNKSSAKKMPKWQLFCVDLILLAGSAYGYFSYLNRQKAIEEIDSALVPVDPVIFVTVILFIAGAALFFLRIYPLLLMGVFKLTKRKLSSSAFASFVQVARGRGRITFIMLFIICSMSICLFNANSARTINASREDVITYETGADMVVMANWAQGNLELRVEGQGDDAYYADNEPPYSIFESLEGAEQVTKVYTTDKGKTKVGSKVTEGVTVMGIEPYYFAQVTQMRDDLFPNAHYYDYINKMTEKENAVLISSAFAEKMQIWEGDSLQVVDQEGAYLHTTVVGIVEYWPSLNPNFTENFVVSNLNFLQTRGWSAVEQMAADGEPAAIKRMEEEVPPEKLVRPYEVWINLKDGVTPKAAMADIRETSLSVKYSRNLDDAMNAGGLSAMTMGTNGILTLGFLVIVAVFILGFLIYWVLSIKSRTLQFGILRSMGMGKSQVISTLGYEQLMLTGASLFIGIFIGGFASELFTPFYQVAYSSLTQVPPFMTSMAAVDYIRVYIIFAVTLIVMFAILAVMTLRSKVNAAIKLGED